MSILWGYDSRKCDGEFCPNNCDNCYKGDIEIEEDGDVTPLHQLERLSMDKAKPAEECMYPRCEDCDKYHGHYCTVPMVVTKQTWHILADKIAMLGMRLTEWEIALTDEIAGGRREDQ